MMEKKCKYCAMMVPKEAKICPYCRKQLTTSFAVKAVIALFLIIVIVPTIVGKPTPSAPDTAANKEPDPKTMRAIAAATTIKKAMRNPNSFKLTSAIIMDSGAVCFGFKSQNGFGGMNTSKAVLLSKSDDIKTNEMAGFNKLWNKECANKSGNDIADYLELVLK